MTNKQLEEKKNYILPLWEMKKDGTKGKLLCHGCCKCGSRIDGQNSKFGTWYEAADNSKRFFFVCNKCIEGRKCTHQNT